MFHSGQSVLAATASLGNWVLLPVGILVIVAVLLGSVFLLAIRARQIILESGFPAGAPIDRQDRRYWRNGFYANPQDPALWVTRPLGQTINVGHPKGMLVLGAILAGVLLIVAAPTIIVLMALQ